MLGADRAAALDRQLEHGLVGALIVGVGAQHVHVDISVAEVPEQDHPLGAGLLDRAGNSVDEPVELAQRDADVELVRHPGVFRPTGRPRRAGPTWMLTVLASHAI